MLQGCASSDIPDVVIEKWQNNWRLNYVTLIKLHVGGDSYSISKAQVSQALLTSYIKNRVKNQQLRAQCRCRWGKNM